MRYFVTGIGTDVGKTVVSAVLVEALKADYWKPIQCGMPRDLETVQALVSNSQSKFCAEHMVLKEPASPHQAAAMEGVTLDAGRIEVPEYRKDLVVEGAGGILVPLNHHQYMIDLLSMYTDQAIVVIRMYLGCINHSLLTLDFLQSRGVSIKGLIFSGTPNEYSEQAILNYTNAPKLLHIPEVDQIGKAEIKQWAQLLLKTWD